MSGAQPNNPMHGLTLEVILNSLIELYGWETLGKRIKRVFSAGEKKIWISHQAAAFCSVPR